MFNVLNKIRKIFMIILNITKFIKPGSLISMFHNNEIKAYIFKEIKISDDHLTDSVLFLKSLEVTTSTY